MEERGKSPRPRRSLGWRGGGGNGGEGVAATTFIDGEEVLGQMEERGKSPARERF